MLMISFTYQTEENVWHPARCNDSDVNQEGFVNFIPINRHLQPCSGRIIPWDNYLLTLMEI